MVIKIFFSFFLCVMEVTSLDKDINNSNQFKFSCPLVFGTCILSTDLIIFHFFFVLVNSSQILVQCLNYYYM